MKVKLFIFTFILIFFASKVKSFAFCIHNKTTKIIAVIEKYGGEPKKSFREILEPEDVKCCNWRDRWCNKEGKSDSIVGFVVMRIPSPKIEKNKYGYKLICEKKIKADGDLYITEDKDLNYSCK